MSTACTPRWFVLALWARIKDGLPFIGRPQLHRVEGHLWVGALGAALLDSSTAALGRHFCLLLHVLVVLLGGARRPGRPKDVLAALRYKRLVLKHYESEWRGVGRTIRLADCLAPQTEQTTNSSSPGRSRRLWHSGQNRLESILENAPGVWAKFFCPSGSTTTAKRDWPQVHEGRRSGRPARQSSRLMQ